jgi:myosin heavy subunit
VGGGLEGLGGYNGRYGLTTSQTFPYLREAQGLDVTEAGSMFDMFAEVAVAFGDVGFSEEERTLVSDSLAAILHLGRVQFSSGSKLASARLDESTASVLARVADRLDLNCKALEAALLTCVNYTRGERVVREHVALFYIVFS